MYNIENKCKNFKNASTFIYFAKSNLQNKVHIWLIEVILQIRKLITMKRTYFQCNLFLLGAI